MPPTVKQREDLLNFDGWVRGWARDTPDYVVGERILALLAPVVLHLLERGLAVGTIRRHKANLRMLGQKVLDKLTRFPEDADGDAAEALDELLSGCEIGEGGPELNYMGGHDPELQNMFDAEQREFDTTCRLVWKFRAARARGGPALSAPGT